MKTTTHLIKAITLFLAIWASLPNNSYAQNAYYYFENQKYVLEPVTQKLLVKFKPEVSFDLQRKILEEPFLKPFEEPPVGSRKGYNILETLDGTSLEEIQNYLDHLRQNENVLSASTFYRSGDATDLMAETDELLVQLKSPNDLPLLEEEAETLSLTVESPEYFNPHLYLVKVSKSSPGTSTEIAARLHESNKFKFVEPNFLIEIKKASNDPLYDEQWGLENTGTNTAQWNGTTDADIDADDAWSSATGEDVIIAIMDDGVELSHPDLGPGTRMLSGFDATGTYPDGRHPNANVPHGTACAGIAAATMDNGIGVAGVAPNAKILPIRLYNGLTVLSSHVVQAFNYAICFGADVLCNPWGTDAAASQAANDAIYDAVTIGRYGKGAVVLAATGNGDLARIK